MAESTERSTDAPKQPNIFGPVLAAILVAAAIGGIIFGIYWLHSEAQATNKPYDDLHKEIARTDIFLRALKGPSPPEAPPPAPAPIFMITLTAPVPIQTESGTVTLLLEQRSNLSPKLIPKCMCII